MVQLKPRTDASDMTTTVTTATITTTEEAAITTTAAMSVKLPIPKFDAKTKRYERYIQEVEAWCSVNTGIEEKQKAVVLALSLPDTDESGVKDKLFNDISLADLSKEDGVKVFIEFMDGLFKKDDLSETYERYVQFDRFQKIASQNIDEFIIEFDKLYNRAAKRGVNLPDVVKAFKLLDAAKLSHQDKLFVLTAVDYAQKDKMYDQTKAALRKFKGGQATPGCLTGTTATGSTQPIKLEPAFIAEHEEALMAAGYVKKNAFNYNSRRNISIYPYYKLVSNVSKKCPLLSGVI